jgi:hypothetical protein
MRIKFKDYEIEIKESIDKIELFIKPFDFDYSTLGFEAKDVINSILLEYAPIYSRINIYSKEGLSQLKIKFDNKVNYLIDDYELNKIQIKKYTLLSKMCIFKSRFYKNPF